MRHTVLRRPVVFHFAARIKNFRALPQPLKIAALLIFSRARPCAAEQQAALRIAEGEAVFLLANIHPADRRSVFKREHIGALLMHTQEEKAGHIDDWKMRGEHNRLRSDRSARREHLSPADRRHHGMLIDLHIL